MQPYPPAPDLFWPGHLHGTGCLSVRAMDTWFATVVRRAYLGWGLAVFWPFLVEVGVVRARIWVFAFSLPFLAGACGSCVWVGVWPLSRLF